MDRTGLARIAHEGGVAEVSLSRAPVNALTPDFLNDFKSLMQELEADTAVRAILLTSPFKVFSAGLDLKEAQGLDQAGQAAIAAGLNHGFLSLFACAKPTVAAVNGAAIAGGLFFVLASDVRIATAKARFGLAEVRVGVDFPIGPMEIARATLSTNDLRRLMLTGQPIGADTAERAGIVDAVVTEDELRTRALDEAHALARIPPKAYAAVKGQIRGETIAAIKTQMDKADPQAGWFTEETAPAMRRMIG
ncbi:enoyl-CoA hydratase/isomerase family protein [Thalassococcus sp. S3]|uniref:enoyl-CoA hydratase/isomerase family protein n=1 Tax=Thalassococcus sp. S3 TaxID=2017482 RepID=UPI001024848E|nr:enoyl-CoA hydratase/isomerase family protein [Thalassococcus sp. S3]QBF31915.1 crotonase [Thalassococcus sp. S3]